MTLELSEIIFILLGLMLSIVAFFLKRESQKIDSLSKKIRLMEVDLAKNSAKDGERWRETQKLLEDRRLDIIKIFEKLNK
jgi:predicted Holliday junction resolvase-like endonuclease